MSLSEEDLQQFRTWVDQAIVRAEEVVESFPDERLLRSVRQQLEYLFRVTRPGEGPTQQQLKRFALDLTARRLEEVDAELSRLFGRMSNYAD